jgi:hypothetical protein
MKKNSFEQGSYAALMWLFVIIAGLWVLWYYTGGPSRANTQTGPFMEPLAPLGSGQGYDTVGH